MDNQTIEYARKALNNAPSGVYVKTTSQEAVKRFYSNTNTGVADVFEQAANEGYQVLFMPELALARTGSNELFQKWYVTPSLRATGQTRASSKVVVYAHVPNFYSNPTNVRDAIKEKRLVNGAGPIPQEEFDRLVSLDGNGRVFIVPYEKLKESSSGVISVDSALEHPQTIPFLGLNEKDAKAYLAKHKEVFGERIGVWHSDDFDKKTPRGRVLCLGDYDVGLDGDYDFGGGGLVLGVAPEAPVAQKNGASATLERKVERVGNDLLRFEDKLYMPVPASLTPKQ